MSTTGLVAAVLAAYIASGRSVVHFRRSHLRRALFADILRVIAVGDGWVALRLTGSLGWLFAALSLALAAYGVILCAAVASGGWFARTRSSAKGSTEN